MATAAGTYSYTDLRKLWIKAGGNRAWSYVMAAIAMAESSGNPHAHHVDANGTVDWGLWQINSVHFRGNVNATTMQNPLDNAKEAVSVFNSSGPHAWSTFNNGSYKHFMPSGKSTPGTTGQSWGVFTSGSSVDQGVDFVGAGAIPALDKAQITDVGHVNIIEGGSWPEIVYKLLAGPYKGQYVYTMENVSPEVKRGQVVQKGQEIAKAKGQSPYMETGFNRQAVGINPIAPLYPNPHSPKPAGLLMQKYIQADIKSSGGGGVVDTGLQVLSDLGNPVQGVIDAGSAVAGGAKNALFGGIESLILQGFFILIGILLVIGGLALVAWTVMGKVGAPGVIGMAQSQMRIRQSGARIQESNRASTARESLRGQSLAESGRASRVRETQATERLTERQRARELSERRLEVHERGVARREPKARKFSDVKRDDRTVQKKKPGRKVSGPPKKS